MSGRSVRSDFRNVAKEVRRLPKRVYRFAVDWWSTRRWSSLAWGAPAIGAALTACLLGLLPGRTSPGELARIYRVAGEQSLRAGDPATADVCFRRLAYLDDSGPAALYGLALAAERQKDLPRARQLLRRIAPDSQAGHPDAHYWLAQDLIRQKAPATLPTLRVLEHHLRQAVGCPAGRFEAGAILAQLYAAGGQPERAIAELEQVVSVKPESHLQLARLYAQVGRTGQAHRAAAKAGECFQARAEAEPDAPQHRLDWASSYVLQERFEDAIDVLKTGLLLADPQPFQQALAAAYFHWFDSITSQGSTAHFKPQPVQQLNFLERVLQYDPRNERALAMLGDLTFENEAAEPATALLKRVLDGGEAPVSVDLVLGTRALEQGDFDKGLMHLQRAQARNVHVPEVLNNLAWGLAHKDKPDLQRALQLATASEQLAKHPETKDTIGTILLKLGRPREAVSQLEAALRGLPPRADLHRKLGDLYEQLGDAGLANEHRRLARQLAPSR